VGQSGKRRWGGLADLSVTQGLAPESVALRDRDYTRTGLIDSLIRAALIALMRDDVTVSLVTSKRGLVVMLSREFKKLLGQIKHACE